MKNWKLIITIACVIGTLAVIVLDSRERHTIVRTNMADSTADSTHHSH